MVFLHFYFMYSYGTHAACVVCRVMFYDWPKKLVWSEVLRKRKATFGKDREQSLGGTSSSVQENVLARPYRTSSLVYIQCMYYTIQLCIHCRSHWLYNAQVKWILATLFFLTVFHDYFFEFYSLLIIMSIIIIVYSRFSLLLSLVFLFFIRIRIVKNYLVHVNIFSY